MYAIPFLDIPPLSGARGAVRLPGSKSISNRVLLLAALSQGPTLVHGLLDSDDTRVMLAALAQLGVAVEALPSAKLQANTAPTPTSDLVPSPVLQPVPNAALDLPRHVVHGIGARAGGAGAAQRWAEKADLFLGNAGTAMRPLLAALAVMGGDYVLRGVARMHERPIGDLVSALNAMGCAVSCLEQPGFPPLHVGVPQLRLQAPIGVRGDVSSQFLTALLMALPLASADQDIVIEVQGELISKPYIAITLQLLARFGIHVHCAGWQRFTIPQGSVYQSPGEMYVESDASSASYFIALGALAAPEGLRIEGLGSASIQGDIRFIEAAQAMGADVQAQPHALLVKRGAWPLHSIDLDCNHIPDAAMTLAVMALYAHGVTRLRNIASWRVKETDRLSAMATELRKLGASVEEGSDFIAITPPARVADWRSADIHTYDDHRMAMCFSLAAFNPAGLPVRIQDPACVAKTFPDYFETLWTVTQADTAAIPVLAIDGPSASGKGTLAQALANSLGYHYLDSGALYRVTAWLAQQLGVAWDDGAAVARLASGLVDVYGLRFASGAVWLRLPQAAERDIAQAIRTEDIGLGASRVAALPAVREALLTLQRSYRRLPGLVADGRDMASTLFPDAQLKIFLTASAAARAQRRHAQLTAKGEHAIMEDLVRDLQERDARDQSRSAAPLQAAPGALLLDNSALDIASTQEWVMQAWHKTGLGRP